MSTLKVGAIRGVSASSDAITVANDGTCTANVTSVGGGQLSNRNKIINGEMVISQRGTSFTSTGNEYTVDRFQHQIGSSFNGDTTTTQTDDHPPGFKNSLKITPDSTQTPTGSENLALSTQLEGFDVQDFAHGSSAPKSMTLSFYAKSGSQNSNHVYSIQIRKYDASGNRKYVVKPFTVTTSWQRFSFTFTGDTATAIANVNTVGIQIVWQLACGPDDLVSETSTWITSTKFQGVSGMNNFMDNTSNEFFLTGVQFEVGSVATDFEHRSFGQELALCQRYYEENTCTWAGFTAAAQGNGSLQVDYKVAKRVTPTLSTKTAATSVQNLTSQNLGDATLDRFVVDTRINSSGYGRFYDLLAASDAEL